MPCATQKPENFEIAILSSDRKFRLRRLMFCSVFLPKKQSFLNLEAVITSLMASRFESSKNTASKLGLS